MFPLRTAGGARREILPRLRKQAGVKEHKMTRNQLLFFRFILFLAGAGIIVLAFFLTKGDRELNRSDAFIWTSIGLMYLIFSLPFFFSAINIANFSGKIPSLALIWTGIFFYIIASVILLLLLAFFHILSINMVIIIQAVLLFIFAINVYFAYFASSHVGNVAMEEAGKQQYLNQIKPKAQTLLLLVNKLPVEFSNAQKTLTQSIEQIKFIYPVDRGAGINLESQIFQSLNKLSELCSTPGAIPSVLEGEAEKLLMLVKERKLLRN